MASHQGMLTFAVTVVLLLLALPSLNNGETLHVRPTSSNTSCPTHPCHTLSEYAQDSQQYFNASNLTLQFLPGNHTLDVNMTITSIHQLEILGNSSAVIPTRVVCSSHIGFTFWNISEMRINGLVFVICARHLVTQTTDIFRYRYFYFGLYLQSVQTAELIDCTFQDSYGSALGVVNSHVILRGNNNFLRNCRMCSNRRCYNYFSRCYGGGIFAQRSNLTFTGKSSFIGNTAYSGGGINAEANSNVDIHGDVIFTDNSVSGSGGGVYVEYSVNVNFHGNTIFGSNVANWNGGGVYAGSKSKVNISWNTTFSGNVAGEGGGVSVGSNSKVIISGNTTFIANSATRYGGGVYTEYDSNVNISENVTFIGNSGNLGGGVYVGFNNSVDIRGNATFTGNVASDDGGGIYAESNSNITISGNSTFICNSATYNGGGIYAESQSNMIISGNSTFIGNSADANGGGIYALSNSNVNISGMSTFVVNSAGGRTIYAMPKRNVDISENTISIGNSATFGGGIYVGSSSTVDINGYATFIGNSASGDGGGVYAISSNSVNIGGNTIFNGNSATNGGCIFVDTLLNLWGNCTFTNCLASVGGAIYAKGTRVKINGTNVFNGNTAKYFGGGIYVPKSTLNLLGDNRFSANWAGSRGGGIYAQETAISFSGAGLLSHNMVQLDGGGMYVDGSNLNFNGNITIRNNTAQRGGGIYSDNNTFSIDGHNVVEKNFATYYGGGIYTQRSPFFLNGNNTFISNSAGEGGAIYATVNSTLNSNGLITFIGNRAHISGGGIWLDHSNLTLDGSNHFVGCVASYEGGAVYTYATTASLPGNNTFESNSATTGGGIHARWSDVSVTNSCNFKRNIAVFGGGVFTDNSTFEFNDLNTLQGNQANHTGGGIYAAKSVLNFLGTSTITANRATRDGGGIYTRDDCVVNLLGLSHYHNNSAGDTGGGISAYRSSFILAGQNTFNSNHAMEGGGFYAFKNVVNSFGKSIFIGNFASNHGGGFTVMHGKLHFNGSTTFRRNSAASGGGLYTGHSTVDINGSNCFMNNMANSEGGGMYARDSVVEFNKKDVFVANSAGSKGAAIHASFTTLIFQGSSSFMNNSAEYGGGVYSESSNLTFVHLRFNHYLPTHINCNDSLTLNVFLNNTALRGGAQYFDLYSNLTLYQRAHVCFQDNRATEFGGAIYAADILGPSQFLSQQHIPFRSECFFHMKEQSLDLNTTPLVFFNNSAGMRGGVLYGGLLEKCNFTSDTYTSALDLFTKSIVHVGRKDDETFSISSDPTQLCFCNKSELNCTEVTQSRSIYPGQQIMLSVVAIDQSSLAIPTLIHTNIHSGPNLTVSETISYQTGRNCTSRNYSVTPKNIFNQLELYPNNRSGVTVHLTVNITFESCPIGFEQSNITGECICDHRLWQYTNSCDIDRQAILRNASRRFWLGVSYSNGTPEGFIYHPYCPLDYCTKESRYINLKNSDKQCNFNHSGLLCGKCKKELTLVLGSSQCKYCSNNYLALLVAFALAGVILIILLLLLHLTVSAGTLHGLIFYANIVAANHHIFFPQSSNNPASIFIAWLNLDLGIQTCFYSGMDAYAKTWLDVVFPVYIWVLMGLLVYISHHSVTMTKLLGSNPVPVLATLFLLSYAKVLRTIIAALSLTILHYPHKNVVVWIHDANVPLAKYVPLVLVALIFLLFLFLPYTLLLLLGQWLQAKSYLPALNWVRNPKLKAILDTYHAPYKRKH